MKKIDLIKDFDKLNFHDSSVENINYEDKSKKLVLDIIYIVEWIKEENSPYFKFKKSKGTLTLREVSELSGDIEELEKNPKNYEIYSIERGAKGENNLWKITFEDAIPSINGRTSQKSISFSSNKAEFKLNKETFISK